MIGAGDRRMAVLPDVGAADLAERPLALRAAGRHDDGQFVDGGRAMPCVAGEARVVGVGDGLDAQKEVIHVHAVHGALVILGVLGTHEEFAGGDQREFGGDV